MNSASASSRKLPPRVSYPASSMLVEPRSITSSFNGSLLPPAPGLNTKRKFVHCGCPESLGLDCLLSTGRSWKDKRGFSTHHLGLVYTLFSASNYCGTAGNKARCDCINGSSELSYHMPLESCFAITFCGIFCGIGAYRVNSYLAPCAFRGLNLSKARPAGFA